MWYASVGRITAEVLTIPLPLSTSPSVTAWFKAEMREDVGVSIAAATNATEEQRHHLTRVAWLAFDRWLARHQRLALLSGTAWKPNRQGCNTSSPILPLHTEGSARRS
ncbi:hypothetical protein [Aureimonas ureilytica]|uniref:hypothetical protein n=1 Tax=Aureimonas ureilytica TaxID=401562 RepID=UPI00128EF77B|nr:hypothetical protein [Aureimonas ureilytica]